MQSAKEKIKCNLTSSKMWVWYAATALLIIQMITESTWLIITGSILGGRVLEYYAAKKNGNGGTQ